MVAAAASKMKLILLKVVLVFASLGNVAKSESSPPLNSGVTGRYCAQGSYNLNTGDRSGYSASHYCGLHPIDVPMCISISYMDNSTRMDCDNAGGSIPKCSGTGYQYQGDLMYFCCDSDSCNDCSQHPSACVSKKSLLTTTTTTTVASPITTTTNSSIGFTNNPNPQSPTTRPSNFSPASKFSVPIFVFAFVLSLFRF